MIARSLHTVIRGLVNLLVHTRTEGFEKRPAQGPYIIVANHLVFWDAPILYALIGGPELSGWAAEKYRYNPIWGTLLRMGRGIFIQRGQVDRDALSGAVDWLKQGKIFAIAPEGTRSRTGGLGRGKSGVPYIAQASGAPILPIAHFGTEKVVPAWLHLRRPVVHVRMGKPFRLPPLPAGDRSLALREQADLVMCHIAALLPAAYRGVYADHPELKRLLAESTAA